MTGAFRPIEAQTLVDKAANEVKRLIDEGHLQVGDQLPPERELVTELGISRTALREALSTLEALGFIERRSTRGRFVASGGSGPRSRALVSAWLHQHAAEIAEIDEVRALIESHALSAASPEDVAAVVQRLHLVLVEQQDAIERGDAARAAAADTEFHKLVCSMTRNTTLLDLATALVERSRQVSVAAYAIPESAASGLREHSRVVDALVRENIENAAECLRDHIVASGLRNVEAGEFSAETSRPSPSRRPAAGLLSTEIEKSAINPDTSPIQIEQRVPRCSRCGKMINIRGAHFAVAVNDRGRLLFCSAICRDEFAALSQALEPFEPAATSESGGE